MLQISSTADCMTWPFSFSSFHSYWERIVVSVMLALTVLRTYLILPVFPPTVHFDQTIQHPEPPVIPKIVHFVYLEDEELFEHDEDLELSFDKFLAVYSAHLYLNPDKIYIHTNIPQHILETFDARPLSSHMRAIRTLDEVEFMYTQPPLETAAGVRISEGAHKADMVRTQRLHEMGGIYLDLDVYALRSFDTLRRSGFRNIIGHQEDGSADNPVSSVNNGVMMAIPKSDLMTVFERLQDRVFDRQWQTHSINLLSSLVHDLGSREGEVLVMPKAEFHDGGWVTDNQFRLYGPSLEKPGQGSPFCEAATCKNATQYAEHLFTQKVGSLGTKDWDSSFCGSYAMHAFGVSGSKLSQRVKSEVFEEFGGVTLDYVLARTSIFARVVYPAVQHALNASVLVPPEGPPLPKMSRFHSSLSR